MVLMKHEAWRNPELWGATLDELIARDKQRWMNLQVNERVSLLQCQCNSVTLCICFACHNVQAPRTPSFPAYRACVEALTGGVFPA
jgi:hypothetical protein